MKQKLLTLLTLLLGVCSGAWADDAISCSAYLSATAGSPTVTDCAFKYFAQDGQAASNTPNGTNIKVSAVDYYYAKMNNDKNYYEIALNKTVGGNNYTTFVAGDVITVYLYTNGATVGYKVGKTAQTVVSLTNQTQSTIVTAPHTLTAAEIESDGTLRIYRNSSNTYFAGITVAGTRATEIYTVTFNAGTNGTCGTAALTEASAGAGVILPAVTPNSSYAFNGWYDAASDGTKVGNAGETYNPTANITLYAQYITQVAPGIDIDNYDLSTPRGKAITFTATTTGAPAPTVTWYQSATAVTSGGTSKGTGNTYTPDVTTIGTYYFYAVASNGVGSDATSNLITLTVTNPDVDRSGHNTYYVAANETAVGGEQVLCDDVTMVYDNVTYNTANADNMVNSINANYVASISSGTNGWGVTFTPASDGVLSVGVVINGDKTFSITNATSFSYNGLQDEGNNNTSESSGTNASGSWKPSKKQYTIITLNVTSGTSYKFSVSGSKMSLYGFEFISPVSKPITAAGWATYCSPYALDLANATGLTDAYIVTGGAGGVLTKTSVKSGTVPANTGLLLKGDEGTATIPVVASSATDVSANKLVGVTANTVIDANAGYVLMASPSLGFYKNNNAFTVGANTSYLPSNFAGADARGFFLLDDATAIDAIAKSQEPNANSYYNLAGQRVTQPTKGLYIKDGKKVIIK